MAAPHYGNFTVRFTDLPKPNTALLSRTERHLRGSIKGDSAEMLPFSVFCVAWKECVCIIRIRIVIIRHLIKRLRGTRVANVASEAVGIASN